MSFPRYPEYKDSGVEWIGEVPKHWTVCALSYRYEVALGKMLDEKKYTGEHPAPYLRNVDVQWGRINTDDLPQMDFKDDDLERYSLKPGDLLVCEGGEVGRAAVWAGQLAECYYQKALHRLRAKCEKSDLANFFFYTLSTAAKLGVFSGAQGKSTIAHLTAEAFRRYLFAFPPRSEQLLIQSFLARELTKIDDLMAEQEKLIALLKEKRQAVISHAVTKGLNPAVPIKDSGVEWLGKVPVHWHVMPIRLAAKLESGHTPSRSRPEYWEDCYIPWMTLADVWQIRRGKADYIYETKETVSDLGLANSSARLLPKGTVVLSRTASVGFSAIMGVDMATTQDFANWVCGEKLIPKFLLFVFRSMEGEFRRLMMGSTHNTIYMPDIQAFRFVLPSLEEQRQIIEHCQRFSAEFDELIDEAQRGIDLLKERRTALISAAVTGQIDVRGLIKDEQEQAA